MGLFIKKPFSMLQAEANESGAKTLNLNSATLL